MSKNDTKSTVKFSIDSYKLKINAQNYSALVTRLEHDLVSQSKTGTGQDKLIIEDFYKTQKSAFLQSTVANSNDLIVPVTFYLVPSQLLRTDMSRQTIVFRLNGKIEFMYVSDGNTSAATAFSKLASREVPAIFHSVLLQHTSTLSNHAAATFRMQQEELNQTKSNNLDLRKALHSISPHYPPPNSDGEWTANDIASYYGISAQTVSRTYREVFRNANTTRGRRTTMNQDQMQRVVRKLKDKPQTAKKMLAKT